MSDEKIKTMGIPFSVWGDVTEEKVKKAVENKARKLINEEKLTEENKGKKDKLLQVRISPEYYETLKNAAQERNMNVSLLVREAVLQYIPTTLTQEEKELIIEEAKRKCMVNMIWSLTNINAAIRENYDYEMSFIIPDNETLMNMYNDNAFKSIKIQAINEIIDEIALGKEIDNDIEESIKKLIKAYMSK